MADQLSTHDSDGITWTEGTTSTGQKFRFGTKETESSMETTSAGTNEDKVSSSPVVVYWPLGNKLWKTTSSADVAGLGISKYTLYDHHGHYKYCLDFVNTRGWWFAFKDRTGDTYRVSTPRNGKHCLEYDSDAPEIVEVA